MFSEAQGIVVTGGRFMHVEGGDIHVHNNHFQGSGDVNAGHARAMEILRQNIASGAFHDAAERFDPPKCHPQTRKVIIEKIMDWIEDVDNLRYFLWVYGPAGAGKSAIAQTIAEMCAKAGILAASFFFSRTAPGRNRKTHFIPSLAYQLCISIPKIRVHVAMAVDNDPSIFSRSLLSQIEALIIKPFNKAAAGDETQGYRQVRPRLIIVDGLDECDDASSQREILEALSASVRQLAVPISFLVSSRAEHEIRQVFNSPLMRSFMTGMPLDNSYEPDADIRVFLKSKFTEIKENHPSRAYLPPEWPSTKDIDHLVEKSSGQFIYASTVMKYVESRHNLPVHRLKVVLGLSAAVNDADAPFAQLDALYAHILSSVHDSNLQKALEILSWSFLDIFDWPLALADHLFSLQSGGARMIISDLHALLHIPEIDSTDQELRILHASFPDFLLDQSRSRRFFIDASMAHTNLARRWLDYYRTHMPELIKAGDLVDSHVPDGLLSLYIASTIGAHCGSAYLSAELQIDLYNFEIDTSFSITGSDKDTMWLHLAAILDFISWLEHQTFADPSKDVSRHLFLRMQKHIQTYFSRYPKDLQLNLSVALTFSAFLVIDITPPLSVAVFEYLIYSKTESEQASIEAMDRALLDFGDHEWHSPFTSVSGGRGNDLLCRLLTNETLPMAGGYFVDQSKYANLALEIARFLFPPGGRLGMAQRWFNYSRDRYWASRFLALILSKASPDQNLAEILRDNALQFNTSSIPVGEDNSDIYKEALPALAIASLFYIQECHIPFREHSHNLENDVCYVFLSQEREDELSVEPIPERVEELVPPRPRQLLPLFLFAWFARMLEILTRDIRHMYL